MRISDWSSDVCSSDLRVAVPARLRQPVLEADPFVVAHVSHLADADVGVEQVRALERGAHADHRSPAVRAPDERVLATVRAHVFGGPDRLVYVTLVGQGLRIPVRGLPSEDLTREGAAGG